FRLRLLKENRGIEPASLKPRAQHLASEALGKRLHPSRRHVAKICEMFIRYPIARVDHRKRVLLTQLPQISTDGRFRLRCVPAAASSVFGHENERRLNPCRSAFVQKLSQSAIAVG